MNETANKPVVETKTSEPAAEVQVIKTDEGAKDGQTKCPKCGSTDIAVNANTGILRCNFCRHEFEPQKVAGIVTDLHQLTGQVIGSGAQDIVADVKDVLTFKCASCGAEVVVDTAEAPQARCHWCRNTLSVNQQIPNGAIPDMVLPFKLPKAEAQGEIEKFVGKRKFFAHPKFKEEFTTQNIMGVYLPYMVIDVNAHANFAGQGEHLTKTYYRGSDENRQTYYDADLYAVEREFDIYIDNLTVESSADKLDHQQSGKTNNVINAIMPFDIENCVKWDANYLKGYTSEKRDTNIEQLKTLVDNQSKDIARYKANEVLKQYDRGVCWAKEELSVKGQQWSATYLPVWLYSYQQKLKSGKQLLHYVAVNARTKETMGSVPINMTRLAGVSAIVELIGLLFWWFIFIDWDYGWTFIFLGIIFFALFYLKYRNSNARHTYETETKSEMENLRSVDQFIESRKGLTNPKIKGANNLNVSGKTTLGNSFLDTIAKQTQIGKILNNADPNNNQNAKQPEEPKK